MSPFVEYERQILRKLLAGRMGEADINDLLDSAQLLSCDHTGVGYFLCVEHDCLSLERVVRDVPLIIGNGRNVEC